MISTLAYTYKAHGLFELTGKPVPTIISDTDAIVRVTLSSICTGDRVTVNVETFCGECFFCKRGYVNNRTDPDGGWALGCRIDDGQAGFVRVPLADQGLEKYRIRSATGRRCS